MSNRIASFFVAAFLAITAFTAAPTAANAAPPTAGFTIPMNSTGAQGTFTGVMKITGFAVENNTLVATGIVSGTMTGASGANAVVRTFTAPVITGATRTTAAAGNTAAAAASCGILHLELGPLDLDLLGLVVHLDRIVLDLSAAPGAGNLLGNLLCSITNLLNAGGALTQLANLLNQLLGILG